ncbi:MAG: hypothetical protein P4L33_00665 [Capsulimonadaceae bacterium]|nr:hypothetical protein [Capsulimonadaceae bacterium]
MNTISSSVSDRRTATWNPRGNRRKLFGVIVAFVLVGAVAAPGLILTKFPGVAAHLVDDFLRPAFGDEHVARLERVLFDAQDCFDRLRGKRVDLRAIAPEEASAAAPPSRHRDQERDNKAAVPLPMNLHFGLPDVKALPGEGVWKRIGRDGLVATFVRTDKVRPYAVVSIVRMPMRSLRLGMAAGLKQPGGQFGFPGPGKITTDLQRNGRLVATFNGGFRYGDGHYGMQVENARYAPIVPGFATAMIYRDGHAYIAKVNSDRLPKQVIAARENGPLLVANGRLDPRTSKQIWLWAGDRGGVYVTWRSGLGVLPNGDLVWAGGPSLTPAALGKAFVLAGCVNAMELDINLFWVRFTLYDWDGHKYKWRPLNKELPDQGAVYLHGNEKDFFYLYRPESHIGNRSK